VQAVLLHLVPGHSAGLRLPGSGAGSFGGSPEIRQGRAIPPPQPGAGQPGGTGTATAPDIRHLPGDGDRPGHGPVGGSGSARPVAGQGRAVGSWRAALLLSLGQGMTAPGG